MRACFYDALKGDALAADGSLWTFGDCFDNPLSATVAFNCGNLTENNTLHVLRQVQPLRDINHVVLNSVWSLVTAGAMCVVSYDTVASVTNNCTLG